MSIKHIWHFGVTWLISREFTSRDVKPVAFLVSVERWKVPSQQTQFWFPWLSVLTPSKQRPEYVSYWSCFGRDFPDQNRTKIGRIKILSGFWQYNVWYTTEIKKNRKIPWKLILWIMVTLTSRVRPNDVPLRMPPLALHIGPYGDILRTWGCFWGTSSGRPLDVILPSELVCNSNVFAQAVICY